MRYLFSVVLLSAALGACKSKEDCDSESFDGELFFSSDDSTGTVSGTLQWADTVEDGLYIEIGVTSDNGAYYGALSKGGLFDMPETCGTEMAFRIDKVDSGPFRVWAGIQEDGAGGDSAVVAYVAEGESEVFDLTDGPISGVVVEMK